MATKKQNDFDPNELIKASEDHEKSLTELQQQLTQLDNRVGTNAALAKSFKTAFENDKKMDAVLVTLIVELITKNDDIKTALVDAVGKVDRKWWNGAWKKILTAVGVIVVSLISGLAGYFLRGGQ